MDKIRLDFDFTGRNKNSAYRAPLRVKLFQSPQQDTLGEKETVCFLTILLFSLLSVFISQIFNITVIFFNDNYLGMLQFSLLNRAVYKTARMDIKQERSFSEKEK